jgi:uncharacterized damage-inducible protein DinB
VNAIDIIRKLWGHCQWADAAVFNAVRECPNDSEVWREYAHILGAEAVWLARLERRVSQVPVWPTLTVDDAEQLRAAIITGYDALIAGLSVESLAEAVTYRNSKGAEFTTPIVDMLLQVLLHGQFHRGKINVLLRQTIDTAAPVDYISYVWSVPAVQTDAERSRAGNRLVDSSSVDP